MRISDSGGSTSAYEDGGEEVQSARERAIARAEAEALAAEAAALASAGVTGASGFTSADTAAPVASPTAPIAEATADAPAPVTVRAADLLSGAESLDSVLPAATSAPSDDIASLLEAAQGDPVALGDVLMQFMLQATTSGLEAAASGLTAEAQAQADAAADRSSDMDFIGRSERWVQDTLAYNQKFEELSSFRAGVGQGFLDYANEMTLASMAPPDFNSYFDDLSMVENLTVSAGSDDIGATLAQLFEANFGELGGAGEGDELGGGAFDFDGVDSDAFDGGSTPTQADVRRVDNALEPVASYDDDPDNFGAATRDVDVALIRPPTVKEHNQELAVARADAKANPGAYDIGPDGYPMARMQAPDGAMRLYSLATLEDKAAKLPNGSLEGYRDFVQKNFNGIDSPLAYATYGVSITPQPKEVTDKLLSLSGPSFSGDTGLGSGSTEGSFADLSQGTGAPETNRNKAIDAFNKGEWGKFAMAVIGDAEDTIAKTGGRSSLLGTLAVDTLKDAITMFTGVKADGTDASKGEQALAGGLIAANFIPGGKGVTTAARAELVVEVAADLSSQFKWFRTNPELQAAVTKVLGEIPEGAAALEKSIVEISEKVGDTILAASGKSVDEIADTLRGAFGFGGAAKATQAGQVSDLVKSNLPAFAEKFSKAPAEMIDRVMPVLDDILKSTSLDEATLASVRKVMGSAGSKIEDVARTTKAILDSGHPELLNALARDLPTMNQAAVMKYVELAGTSRDLSFMSDALRTALKSGPKEVEALQASLSTATRPLSEVAQSLNASREAMGLPASFPAQQFSAEALNVFATSALPAAMKREFGLGLGPVWRALAENPAIKQNPDAVKALIEKLRPLYGP